MRGSKTHQKGREAQVTSSVGNICLAASNSCHIDCNVLHVRMLDFSCCRVPGNLRQSCLACFCVVAVYTWSRFAFASQPQSVFHQSVWPAVSMDDVSYILPDSEGSVHMLSESCLGATAKLLKKFTVELLGVSG